MPSTDSRVFTIPPSAPFLPTLLRALIDGTLVPGFPASSEPDALAAATLFLPTRRACALARGVFLDALGTRAAILPRIVPLGEIDEDEIVFAQAATGDLAAAALDLPPNLSELERRLLLARLVQQWAALIGRDAGRAPLVAPTPAAALKLAADLARLIDDMITRQVDWKRLDDLVPEEHDVYWQYTLGFLRIAREKWPAILAERGAIEPAARRDLLIAAEAKRLAARTDGPVIAAGSTGSMPATAALIATIATLPHGAVVLPGLDLQLDDDAWARIGADGEADAAAVSGHPQLAMHALLARLGMTRADVRMLGDSVVPGRERLASETMRPANTTEHWRARLDSGTANAELDAGMADIAVIEAANAEDEALAIAVALRETLESPGATAALITPDRGLARRVQAALSRWNISVDDSGGDALADTPAGLFARLAVEVPLGGLKPADLLALLKHPLAVLADDRAVFALERATLRGPRPRAGSDGLAHALAGFRHELRKLRSGERSDLHRADPRTLVAEFALDAATALVDKLANALAPLEKLPAARRPLHDLAARHHDVIDALSDGAACAGDDGAQLAQLFDEIAGAESAADMSLLPADYAELFRTAVADRIVRRPGRPGVRIRIYGLLEARLQHVDRVVLGGLVEGVWPPETASDPWLSRPMRHALGLDLPERRVSLSAHDFAQGLGAREVVLAYATKLAGAPTVTSRFVQRLAAVAGEERWSRACDRGHRYLAWARALDAPAKVTPVAKPAPRPPRAARPTALAVTDIEHWLRDPYTIFARHILRLRELDAVDTPPGAADRGTVIHGAVGEFTNTYAGGLPADPAKALIDIGRRHFLALQDYPEARAFWWPRFQRIAYWLAAWEHERRSALDRLQAEQRGEIPIALGERTLKLSARADRIEHLGDNHYAILDYKTGQVPTDKQVRIGLAPQLTLEAAILRHGGFPEIPEGGSVSDLIYVSLRGVEPPGEAKPVAADKTTPDAEAERALGKLTEFASRFEDEAQPYSPLVLSMWKTRYGAFDHLARVKEWQIAGDDDEMGSPE